MSTFLRKIVAVVTPTRSVYAKAEVELECGHRRWVWSGTQARTRCRECAAASYDQLVEIEARILDESERALAPKGN